MSIKTVCVVGAGAAGITTLDILLSRGFDTTLFERNNHVGGLWKYDESSPIYDSLVTNLPKEIMAFTPMFSFPEHLSSFLTHDAVFNYLQEVCKSRDLDPYIRLQTNVESIERTQSCDDRGKWRVQTISSHNQREIFCFDAIVICTGHFNYPFTPNILGQSYLKGKICHSATYKNPIPFQDKIVLIIGAKFSASDIARELLPFAREVHVSNRHQTESSYQSTINTRTIFYHPGISHIDSDGSAVMIDGSIILGGESLSIILCTGYCYDTTPLSPIPLDYLDHTSTTHPIQHASTISNDNDAIILPPNKKKCIKYLYEHVFWTLDPTLSFVGLNNAITPFPLFTIQAQWIASLYSNSPSSTPLPSQLERERWAMEHEEEARNKTLGNEGGVYPGNYHFLGPEHLGEYMLKLAVWTNHNLTEIEKRRIFLIQEIYSYVATVRPREIGEADEYRRQNYYVDW
jgi:aliphatic glucosinolate S-oxygenase